MKSLDAGERDFVHLTSKVKVSGILGVQSPSNLHSGLLALADALWSRPRGKEKATKTLPGPTKSVLFPNSFVEV